MIIRKMAFAVALLLASVGSVKAADIYRGGSVKDSPSSSIDVYAPAKSWTAIWAAALVGYSMSNSDLSLDHWHESDGDRQTSNIFSLDGLGGEGFDGTLQLGGDVQLGRFVVGGWGEYQFGGTETNASVFDGAGRLNVEQQDSYSVFARVGLPVNDTLFYAAGGYTWTEAEVSLSGGGDAVSHSFDFSGPAAALGIEHRFGSNVRAKLEGRYTWLDKETVASWANERCGEDLTAEPGILSVKLGVAISTNEIMSPLK